MKTTLNWKKGFFSSTYSIYSSGNIVGNLNDKAFSKSADGEINGQKYYFKTKGFFNKRTEIIDKQSNTVIGEITYNTWMTKATLIINDKTIAWKFDNIWNTKWSINYTDGTEINYSGTSTKGQIDSNTDDDLLLLTGLFVTNYYWQNTIAILVAVFIPIFVANN